MENIFCKLRSQFLSHYLCCPSTSYKERHILTRLSKTQIPLYSSSHLSVNQNKNNMALVGDARDVDGHQNNLEIEDLGKFAVDEHNKKQNALLEFGKVVNAKSQVVAGTLHHLTLEVRDGESQKVYEAKVWEKPWMSFKELQEFNLVE